MHSVHSDVLNNALCEKVGHSRRFGLHIQFKLAFINLISKKAILLGVHKQICKLKIWFSKILFNPFFSRIYRQRCTNFKQLRSLVKLRFRKSISGNHFQTIGKLANYDFRCHKEFFFYSI